jgi:hypothetical protein
MREAKMPRGTASIGLMVRNRAIAGAACVHLAAVRGVSNIASRDYLAHYMLISGKPEIGWPPHPLRRRFAPPQDQGGERQVRAGTTLLAFPRRHG